MQKVTLAILICIFGLLFFTPHLLENAEAVQMVVPNTLSITAYPPSGAASDTFTINNPPQTVYVQYGGTGLGSGHYVKIRRSSTPGTYIASSTNSFWTFAVGTYGAINGQGFASYQLTEPGEYTMEIYAGVVNVLPSTMTAALRYLPNKGKLIRVLRSSPSDRVNITTNNNAPVVYIWSGNKIYPGSLTGSASLAITGNGVNISGGASEAEGHFIATKNLQYTVDCHGGYTENYYTSRTYYPAYVDICYEDSPLTDIISLSVQNTTAAPSGRRWTNNKRPTLEWTNSVTSNRTYKVYKGSINIPCNITQISSGRYSAVPNSDLAIGDNDIYVQATDQYGNPSPNSNVYPLSIDTGKPTGFIAVNGPDNRPETAVLTNNLTVTIYFGHIDEPGGSGLYQIQFRENGSSYGNWVSIPKNTSGYGTVSHSLSANNGTKTLDSQIKDYAGNVYATSNLVTLDTQAPTGCQPVLTPTVPA